MKAKTGVCEQCLKDDLTIIQMTLPNLLNTQEFVCEDCFKKIFMRCPNCKKIGDSVWIPELGESMCFDCLVNYCEQLAAGEEQQILGDAREKIFNMLDDTESKRDLIGRILDDCTNEELIEWAKDIDRDHEI